MAVVLAAGVNNWRSLCSSHEKISAVAISCGHLCIGLADGFVKLFYITKSQHLSLLWKKRLLVRVEHLGFNENETFLVVTGTQAQKGNGGDGEGEEEVDGGGGTVLLLEVPSGDVCCVTELPEKVSAVGWVGQSIYIGGDKGSVYLQTVPQPDSPNNCSTADPNTAATADSSTATINSSTAGPNSFPPAKQILSLDSEVVDVGGSEGILVCSSLTRAVVCNNNNKTYREVGSKLRQGRQGVLVHGGRIWSARPGCRIWEVDPENGNVLATRQFRKVIEDVPETPVFGMTADKGGRSSRSIKDEGVGRSEHGFTLLRHSGSTIISYSTSGLVYLLDLSTTSVLAWTNTNFNIKDLCVSGCGILILDDAGSLHHITAGTLDSLMTASYKVEQFTLCADLFLSNRKLIRSLKQEHLKNILRMKDLSFKLKDSSKATKIYKLMDAVERLGISLNTRRQENRSVSQDRNGVYSSSEFLLKEELRSGRCQSEEDLLDGRKRRKTSFHRDLSSSRRAMSASEQGLQALQLFNIKFGDNQPNSSSSSYSCRSSAESLGPGGRSSKCSDSESSDAIDQTSERFRERLEEQARDAGLEINAKKNKVTAEHKTEEIREFSTRISEWEFGGAYAGLGLQPLEDTNYISDAISGALEDAISGSSITRIGGAALSALLDKKHELESPRNGLSVRIKDELRAREAQSRLDEVGRISNQINKDQEFRVSNTKSLGNLLVQLLLENKKPEDSEHAEHSVHAEHGEQGEHVDLFHSMSESNRSHLQKALEIILGDIALCKLLFNPLLDLNPDLDFSGLMYQQRCLMLDQSAVDLDTLIAHYLEIFTDLLNCDNLVANLHIQNYSTYKKLLAIDTTNRPTLSPIRLEEISPENVFSVSSFLATYRDLSNLDLLRYTGEIIKINPECSIQIIQGQVLDLPPPLLFFSVLQYLEVLVEATDQDSTELMPEIEAEWFSYMCRALAVHIPGWPREWSQICSCHPNLLNFFNNAFYSNNIHYLNKKNSIKGSHKSLEALELSPLANFLMEEAGVAEGAKGFASKEGEEYNGHNFQLAWAKQNSFMPGYVRSLLLLKEVVPEEELPLIIELGDSELLYDVGLLSADLSPLVVKLITEVYVKGECPLDFEEFAAFLLRGSGASNTFSLLIKLSQLMQPGDLSQRFYAILIVKALEEEQTVKIK